MRAFVRLLIAAIMGLAWMQAEAAPVSILNFTSNSTLTTPASTGACTTGQVAVVIATMNSAAGGLSGVTDSAGGTYTVSPAVFNVNNGGYIYTIMAKRVVGSGSQISTATTFTFTVSFGTFDDLVAEAYCVSDGVNIPTSTDGSFITDPPYLAPAPTASTSYQFFAAATYGVDPTIITGAPWTLGNHGLGPGGFAGLATGWRKTGGTQTLDYSGQVSGYNSAGFSEVTASAGPPPSTSAGQNLTLLGVQ